MGAQWCTASNRAPRHVFAAERGPRSGLARLRQFVTINGTKNSDLPPNQRYPTHAIVFFHLLRIDTFHNECSS